MQGVVSPDNSTKTPIRGILFRRAEREFRLAESSVGCKGFKIIDLRKEEGQGEGKGFINYVKASQRAKV